MNEKTQNVFQKQAEEAIEKLKQARKNFCFHVIPTALWMFLVIIAAVYAMNSLKVSLILVGVGAIAGAVTVFVKTLKKYNS